ncbi:putative internal virion protein [Pseudomonas phage MR2]|uniref:Putative internal virion protein n=1 Tax=Pseudomonas phage MR2 TaxID=2711170 RepID=A0A6M3TA83_9CAUD|nr:putative internal virion protein [Pseudomonas phage MR2]
MEFPTKFSNSITVVAIENPRWTNEDHLEIDADVTFELPSGETIKSPFTSSPFDTFGPHCPAIFEHCAGLSVAPWVRPEVSREDLQAEFDKIWPDVALGLADEATVQLAKNLRVQIKAMS